MDRKNVGVSSSLFSSVLDDSWQAVESLLAVTADASSGAGRDGSKRGKQRSLPASFPIAVHERDDAGSTALHLAAARSSTRCMRTLIGAGASLSALDLESAWTPLHKAVWAGNLGAALLLVAAGAALDDTSEAGLTRRGRQTREGWLQKSLTPLAPSGDSAATPFVGGRDGCSPLNLATSALRPRQGVALSQIERERQWLLRPAVSSTASSRAIWPCVIGSRISLEDACSRGCRGIRVRPGGPRPLCTSCLAASTARDGSSGIDRDCGYSSAVSLHSWGKANGFGLGYATAASRDVVLQPRPVDLPATQQQQPQGLGQCSERSRNVEDTTVCAVAAGRHHTLVLTTGGSVLAFGLGQGGKLGLVLPAAASAEPTVPLTANVATSDSATDSPAPLPVRTPPGDTVPVGAKAIPTAQVLPARIPAFLLAGIRVVQACRWGGGGRGARRKGGISHDITAPCSAPCSDLRVRGPLARRLGGRRALCVGGQYNGLPRVRSLWQQRRASASARFCSVQRCRVRCLVASIRPGTHLPDPPPRRGGVAQGAHRLRGCRRVTLPRGGR